MWQLSGFLSEPSSTIYNPYSVVLIVVSITVAMCINKCQPKAIDKYVLSTLKFLASVSSTGCELVLLFWIENKCGLSYVATFPSDFLHFDADCRLTTLRPRPSIMLQLFNCVL